MSGNSSFKRSADLRRLRIAVTLEGATLIMLVLIASPLKRIADLPLATQIMGPVHGLAFLIFLYILLEAVAARTIDQRSALRLFLGALVPFGGVINERWLARMTPASGEKI